MKEEPRIMGNGIKTPNQLRQEVDARTAAGYDRPGPDGAGTGARRGRDEKLAAGFRENPQIERILALKRTDPSAYEALVRSPSTRLSVAHYVEAKAAFEAEREGSRG